MKITVYCASSAKVDQKYFDATETLAKEFVKHNIDIVYGGGSSGLMGKLAETILEHGGKVKGIMPRFMVDVEWANKNVTEFELTETMHERKEKLLAGSDGLVALPGGSGTLEELLEAITFKRLGLYVKPIIILNLDDYYEPLKLMLEKCVSEKFMGENHLQMWSFVDNPEDVINAIITAPAWNEDAIKVAVLK